MRRICWSWSRLTSRFSPAVAAPDLPSPSSSPYGGVRSDPNALPRACTTPLLPSAGSHRQPRSRSISWALRNKPPPAPLCQLRLTRSRPKGSCLLGQTDGGFAVDQVDRPAAARRGRWRAGGLPGSPGVVHRPARVFFPVAGAGLDVDGQRQHDSVGVLRAVQGDRHWNTATAVATEVALLVAAGRRRNLQAWLASRRPGDRSRAVVAGAGASRLMPTSSTPQPRRVCCRRRGRLAPRQCDDVRGQQTQGEREQGERETEQHPSDEAAHPAARPAPASRTVTRWTRLATSRSWSWRTDLRR